MQRLRTHWLALFGAILLLTLTVSSAFGAPPEGNRGQTISGFVHDLLLDDETDEDTDQEEDEEEDTDEEEDLDETDEQDLDEEEDLEEDEEEDTDEDAADVESAEAREVPDEFKNHGECVSTAAHDTEGFDESDAANFGEWVSDHARYICWSLEVPGDEEEEEATDEETDGALDEEADADELSAKEQAKADREAARAERQAAREAARAEREAAKAAQQSGEVTGGNGNGRGGGNGHGRGGGKP